MRLALTNSLIDFIAKFTSWENSIIKAGDLSVSETHAIEILGRNKERPLKMKRLAESLGVTTGTLTVTADRLERKGYAKRAPLKGDRRAFIMGLTGKGEGVYKEHRHLHEKLTEQILNHLSLKDCEAFLRILRSFNEEII